MISPRRGQTDGEMLGLVLDGLTLCCGFGGGHQNSSRKFQHQNSSARRSRVYVSCKTKSFILWSGNRFPTYATLHLCVFI